jgi:alpha-N-acetylglucosamine transferase
MNLFKKTIRFIVGLIALPFWILCFVFIGVVEWLTDASESDWRFYRKYFFTDNLIVKCLLFRSIKH